MQDPRIRIASAAVLSLAAFISLHGAAAVFIWWLVFTPRLQLAKRIRLVFSVILMIAFFSIVLELSGGGGLSYFTRMTVIVLIGMWIFSEQKSGEFLSFGVWLFGNRSGFEIGMIAEMGMQSLVSVTTDIDRIRMAEKIKGMQWKVRSLIPAGLVLVHGALVRAEDTAELLAIRGYRNGGTVCPKFLTQPLDIVAGTFAACIFIFSLIPVSEFFILYR
jgi:energy-coupling factor transporter transmembrane protein EcfT